MTALGNGTAAGQCLGLVLNGLACERFGYKRTMIVRSVVPLAVLWLLPLVAGVASCPPPRPPADDETSISA